MNIHFVFDKTKKASKIKKRFLRIYKNSSPSNSDYFIVAGGDGFMLKTLKRFYKYIYYQLFYYQNQCDNCQNFNFMLV